MTRTLLFGAWLGLAACAGCGSLQPPELNLPARSASRAAATAAVSDQLPTGDAVKACLATAEQLASQGHAREAALLYQKARSLSPAATNYARRLAPLYDLLDDVAAARQEFAAAVVAEPKDADLRNDYGCFLDRIGELAAAEQELRSALALDPQHARARTNLGRNLAHQGRNEEGWREFAAVVGPAAAHYNVGVILARRQQAEPARRQFEEALRLQPDLPQAQQFLTALAGRGG